MPCVVSHASIMYVPEDSASRLYVTWVVPVASTVDGEHPEPEQYSIATVSPLEAEEAETMSEVPCVIELPAEKVRETADTKIAGCWLAYAMNVPV